VWEPQFDLQSRVQELHYIKTVYRGHNCRKQEYFLMRFACVILYPWADELHFRRLPCKVNTTLCTCQITTARIAPDTLSSYVKNAKQPCNNQQCDCTEYFRWLSTFRSNLITPSTTESKVKRRRAVTLHTDAAGSSEALKWYYIMPYPRRFRS